MNNYTDLFDKCSTEEGYFFTRPVFDSNPGRVMKFQGKEVIMWSVNNYLGLAQNEEIREAAEEAVKQHSMSTPMGSRMMSGNTPFHEDFEASLARFTEKEAAILFNYGYLGVIGTIQALVGQDDVILMDKLSHASIVDGVLLSRAQFRVFKHNDPESLEANLKRVNRQRRGGVLIVMEGTYGMTGDLANLPDICALKEKYDARIFLDDAHGWGVMGENGRGTAEFFGVQDKVDIYFGTFAKAFASIGGFSASRKDVIDWIRYNARTQVFAKSLPLVFVKSLMKTFELVKAGINRRERMWEISRLLKEGLLKAGFYIGSWSSPICPVFIPLKERDIHEIGSRVVSYLRQKGVFVTGIMYPVIPKGLFMFRMIPTATHTEEDVELTVRAFESMRDDLKLDLTISGEDLNNIKKIYGSVQHKVTVT